MKSLEVLFTPADFAALKRRNLDAATCVVFDVFRATSSMVAALANGASAIVPVEEIADAVAWRRANPGVLLAGERDGVRIRAGLTGSVDFDLGNSPREFTREKISGKTIVMTTTNGSRALVACGHAQRVWIGSFLNLEATARRIARERAEHLLVVCAGTFDQTALEDALAAGALCDRLWEQFAGGEISDAALMVRRLFQAAKTDLPGAAMTSRNARRLLGNPDLKDDVAFCLSQDRFDITPALDAEGKARMEA